MSSRLVIPLLVAVVVASGTPRLLWSQDCSAVYKLSPVGVNPPSAAGGIDIILIHGFRPDLVLDPLIAPCGAQAQNDDPAKTYFLADNPGVTGAEWTRVVSDLHAAGYRVFTWRWPTNLAISDAGNLLRQEIDNDPTLAPQIVLVGHSMGGLVALQALVSGTVREERVIRVVTLGTPHQGTLDGFLGFAFSASLATAQVASGSAFLSDLETSRQVLATDPITYVLGGRYDDASCVGVGLPPVLTGSDVGDCVVTYASAYDAGQSPGPQRIVPVGGLYWDHYDHNQMDLNYTTAAGFPHDASGGEDLVATVESLVLTSLAPRIVANPNSIVDTTNVIMSAQVQVTDGNPVGTMRQLTATPNAPWVKASLSSSTATTTTAATVTVTLDPTGFAPGTYVAGVHLTAFQAQAVDVPVTMVVPSSTAPILSASETTVNPGETFKLSWSSVVNATSYKLERTENGTWTDLEPVDTSQTSATDHISTSGSPVTVSYRVSANNSGTSNVVQVTAVPPAQTGALASDPPAISRDGLIAGPNVLVNLQLGIAGISSFSWTARAIQGGNLNWLQVQTSSGNQGTTLTVLLRPQNVTMDTILNGTVEILSNQANAALEIPVVFHVQDGSGVDLAISNVFWTPGAGPCDQTNNFRLNWAVANVGTETVSQVTGAVTKLYYSTSPSLTIQDLVAQASLDNIKRGIKIPSSGLAPGDAIPDSVTFPTAPIGMCPLGHSYFYLLADAPTADSPKGIISESNDTDSPTSNNLFVLDFFNPRPPMLLAQLKSPIVSTTTTGVVFDTLTLSNGGDLKALNWSATTSQGGINLTPASGSLAGLASSNVLVRLDGSVVGAESTTVTITIASDSGGTVPVSLGVVVHLAPKIVLSAQVDTIRAQLGGALPSADSVTITDGSGQTPLENLSLDPVQYMSGGPTDWLHPSLDGGTAPTKVRLAIASIPPGAGIFSASVPITAAGSSNTPQAIGVILVVEQPRVALGIHEVSTTALYGGPSPASTSVSIVNGGPPDTRLHGLIAGPIRYAPTSIVDWLVPTLADTTAPTMLNLQATSSGLAVGVDTAWVRVNGANAAPDSLALTISVTGTPVIGVAPGVARDTALQGTGPQELTFSLTNTGPQGTTLAGLSVDTILYLVGAPSWIIPSLLSTTPPTTLSLQIISQTLAAGDYGATVVLGGAGALFDSLQVTLHIKAAPSLSIVPHVIRDSVIAGSTRATSESLSVSLGGDGSSGTTWTAHSHGSWLQLLDSTGTGSGVARWTSNPATLPTGVYAGAVQVSAGLLKDSTIDSLWVLPALRMMVVPALIHDSLIKGDTTSISDSVYVTFTGTGKDTATWLVTGHASWQALAVTTGHASGWVHWVDKGAGLDTGTYTGSVVVQSSADTATVHDTLLVLEPLSLSVTPSFIVHQEVKGGPAIPDSAKVVLAGSGATTTHWSISQHASWQKLKDSTGIGAGTVRWTTDLSTLDTGRYSDSLVVRAAAVSPTPVRESLYVFPPLQMQLSPRSRLDSTVQGTTAPVSDSALVSFTGTGKDTATWRAMTPAAWVSLTTSTGRNSEYVRWQLKPGGLPVGDSVAVITVMSDSLSGSFVDTLRVIEPLHVTVSPQSRFDSLILGTADANRDSVHVIMSGTGSATAPWIVSSHASWERMIDSAGQGSGWLVWTRSAVELDTVTYVDRLVVHSSAPDTAMRDSLKVLTPLLLTVHTTSRAATSILDGTPTNDSTLVSLTGAGATETQWCVTHRSAAAWNTLVEACSKGSGWLRWARNPKGLDVDTLVDSLRVVLQVQGDSQPRTVLDSLTIIAPPISVVAAAKDLLGGVSLAASQRAYLDSIGNLDGRYDLGDLLALLRRTRQHLSLGSSAAAVLQARLAKRVSQ